MDIMKMMGMMNNAKQIMEEVKQEAALEVLEESEMDGAVLIKINGKKEIQSINLAPAFYNQFSNDERESMLTEAINNAYQKVDSHIKQKMAERLAPILPNIPGMDINKVMQEFSL